LNRLGVDRIRQLQGLQINVIVKLHDRSRDLRPEYSGGIDWEAVIRGHSMPGRTLLASGADICPYLAASDVMITDHSSAGFEYLLLDRPLVRVHVPKLLEQSNTNKEYVDLLCAASTTATDTATVIAAVEKSLADPSH